MRIQSGLPALFFLLALAFPTAAQQDIVTNGAFDTDLSGWTQLGTGTWEWDSDDWQASLSSGSAKGTGVDMQLLQCLTGPVLPQYEFTGKYRLESGSAALTMAVSAFSQPGCDGTLLGFRQDAGLRSSGSWDTFQSPSPFVPPAQTQSVQVQVIISGGIHTAWFDELIVTSDILPGSAKVTIQGPGTARVGDIQYFSATGTNCTGSLSRGWSWTLSGGRTVGFADTSTFAAVFDVDGTYSVSASHTGCGAATDSKTVVAGPVGAKIWIWPGASYMYQPVGTTLGRTSYWIMNYGDGASTITLETEGDFFSQSPGSVTIEPDGMAEIILTAKDVASGLYRHRTFFSGDGLSQFLVENGQLIQLLVYENSADGVAEPTRNRIDVTGADGSVTFRNTGTMPLRGMVITTKPWIVPAVDEVTIPAGGEMAVGFSIDRSLRPDSDDPVGSVSGDFGLQYQTTADSVSRRIEPAQTGDGVVASLVTVVDTAAPDAAESGIPPLGQNEVALFIPGAGHVVGSVGEFISDLSLVNLKRHDTLSDLEIFFNPRPGSAGPASQQSTIKSLQPNKPVALADVVGTVFGQNAQLGSLQIRSDDVDSIGITATVFNSSDPAGTFGTTIPVARSDRGAIPGESFHLAGLRSDATHHTNLFIQEMSGSVVSVDTVFLNESGGVLGNRSDTVPGFALVQIGNAVPQGASSAVLTNSGATGNFFAYATPVDRSSGDTWAVSDWPRQLGYATDEQAVVPVAGTLRGANNTFFRTDTAIKNVGSTPILGTLRYYDRTGPIQDRIIALAVGETVVYNDVLATLFEISTDTVGHMIWTPSGGEAVITSRNFTTVEGDVATFGSDVATLSVESSLKPGELIRFGGIEDATLETISQGRPASFRTNFGIVETSGNAARVRVTIRFDVPSTLATSRESGFKEYDLGANGFLLVSNISRTILGEEREAVLGDLRNLEVDFELVSGDGEIVVFTSSVDNGTGDSILKTE